LVVEAKPRHFREATPAMNEPTLPLDGLSPVRGKAVVARFDGGLLSSDSGVIALAQVDRRLRVAERLAACIDDPRTPDQVVHSLADMIGFRMKMIAAGYAPIPCSRWPRMRSHRVAISPPSRRSVDWRTSPAFAN
jgi:hypothetical protein